MSRQSAMAAFLLACGLGVSAPATELGIRGTRFTINGDPVFLLGISYYGALGASEEFIRRDLDDMQRYGFNWLRVWAMWGSSGRSVSVVDRDGSPREPFLDKLHWLVEECDRRGLIVDVTLSRNNGTTGSPNPEVKEGYRRSVELVVTTLKPLRNWYLDLANERNVQDKRFVGFDELEQLRDVARRLDGKRLVTASEGGDISREDLARYLTEVRVDFITPHRPRDPASPGQTRAKTREYLGWMKELGRQVPVHYQEPFRRGYQPAEWEPPAEAFITDLKQAMAGGAAGWCFHNGDQRGQPGLRPRRSFGLDEQRLFDQLDEQEQEVLRLLQPFAKQAHPGTRPEGDRARPSTQPSR